MLRPGSNKILIHHAVPGRSNRWSHRALVASLVLTGLVRTCCGAFWCMRSLLPLVLETTPESVDPWQQHAQPTDPFPS
jgi:hypothetical protein